jgi:hypothetical protein
MTSDSAQSAELPGVGPTFTEVWRLFADRFWLLMAIGGTGAAACMLAVFLPLLAALLVTGLTPSIFIWSAAVLVALSALLWGASWTQVALIEAVLDSQIKPSWIECYRVSWPKVVGFSWACILFFVLVSGGFFFFLAPGIFLGVALVFAPLAVVAEGTDGTAAQGRSLDLVRGRWGPVALRLCIGGLAAAIPGMVPYIGWLLGGLAAPFSMVSAVVIYHNLRALTPKGPAPEGWKARLPFALAAAGLLVMAWMGVQTAAAIKENLPNLQAQFQQMKDHPPSPEKAQQALALLENNDYAAAYQLLQPSTSTAVSLSVALPLTSSGTVVGNGQPTTSGPK